MYLSLQNGEGHAFSASGIVCVSLFVSCVYTFLDLLSCIAVAFNVAMQQSVALCCIRCCC